MQLDKTRVAIRERGYFDLLELSLRVIRGHAAALAVVFFSVAGPLMFFNHFLLTQFFELSLEWDVAWYQFWLVVLIVWEMPLATAPLTVYLGQVLFQDAPNPRRIVADVFRSLPQLILYQWLLRGLLMLVCLMPLGAMYLICPYLSEIILLERNPVGGTYRRSSVLHSQNGGLVFGRWMAALAFSGVLIICFWSSLAWLRHKLIAETPQEWFTLVVDLPLAIWLVVGFFAVVRFLCYLDLRIRREGWEIELRMRAEAVRLTRQLA